MTCLRCAGLGCGDTMCGFCGAVPVHRKPMAVVASARGDSLTPAGRRRKELRQGKTRQEIHDEAIARREYAASVKLIRRGVKSSVSAAQTP